MGSTGVHHTDTTTTQLDACGVTPFNSFVTSKSFSRNSLMNSSVQLTEPQTEYSSTESDTEYANLQLFQGSTSHISSLASSPRAEDLSTMTSAPSLSTVSSTRVCTESSSNVSCSSKSSLTTCPLAKTLYIGVKTAAEAEKMSLRPTEFVLYHKVSNEGNGPKATKIPMMILYRTSLGRFMHYPIAQDTNGFYVQYAGDKVVTEPCLPSIEQLVENLQHYVWVTPMNSHMDVFPWWDY